MSVQKNEDGDQYNESMVMKCISYMIYTSVCMALLTFFIIFSTIGIFYACWNWLHPPI